MEIWNKLRKNKSFRRTLAYTLTSFVNQFGNLLVLPFIWSGLSIEDFALIGLIEAAIPFLACVLTLSTEQYLTRFYFDWLPENHAVEVGKNLSLTFVSVIGIGLIVSFLSLFSLRFLAISIEGDEGSYFLFGMIHIVMFSGLTFPNALFRISNKTRGYIVLNLSLFFVRLILSYILTIAMGLGLFGYLLGMALTYSLFFIGTNIYLFSKYPFILDSTFNKKALRFSLPYIPTNLLANLSNLADRLILSFFGGKYETGLLTLGQKVASIPGSLSQAIKLGYVPFITEFISGQKYSTQKLNLIRMMFVAPVSIISLVLILFGVEILDLVGIKISELGQHLHLLLLIVYLNSNNLFFSPGLYLSKRSDKMWVPNITQIVVRFTLYLILVPSLFLKGVIMASLIASLVSFIHNYLLSEKYFKLELGPIQLLLQFTPFIAAILLALIGMQIHELPIYVKLCLLIVYLGFLWFYLLKTKYEFFSKPY